MHLQRTILSLACAFMLCSAALTAHAGSLQKGAPAAAPTDVVKSFYRFHFAHGMGFTRRSVRQRQRWLAPELYKLLLREFQREDEYAKAHPKESFVPYMEGDPFTDSQEYPTSFRVGKSIPVDNKVDVEVILSWSARSSRGRDERKILVELEKQNGKWLISNILDKGQGTDLLADLNRATYLP